MLEMYSHQRHDVFEIIIEFFRRTPDSPCIQRIQISVLKVHHSNSDIWAKKDKVEFGDQGEAGGAEVFRIQANMRDDKAGHSSAARGKRQRRR